MRVMAPQIKLKKYETIVCRGYLFPLFKQSWVLLPFEISLIPLLNMYVWMDRWMDGYGYGYGYGYGWMDMDMDGYGWMDGWMGGWLGGWVDGLVET